MKILPVSMIREADAYTISHEPISEIELMERAAGTCFRWLSDHTDTGSRFHIFCGTGNNGGDGFVIARQLSLAKYNTTVYCMGSPEKMSPSCKINFDRIINEHPGIKVHLLVPDEESLLARFSSLNANDIIIDAIFGSGLTRLPDGFYARVIDLINASVSRVIAIDVPSGLFCDESVAFKSNPPVVRADVTLSFAPPKLAFFMPENDPFVGKWITTEIGLHQSYLETAEVRNFMLSESDVAPLLKVRGKYSHKGNFGHALLFCGSRGKMGAAVLAAKACLRAGAGLVTVRVPSTGVNILQTAVPEAMLSIDDNQDMLCVLPDINQLYTCAIGPGIGTSPETAGMLKLLIQASQLPMVIDADAINILAENKTWLGFLPKGSILTPHPKEFERLVGPCRNNFERNEMQRDFSIKYQAYVVLKGAHTAITSPTGLCVFNSTGNPGMATGGSGDVLTGIILSLLAQGYTAQHACYLGVYIHGLAGDFAMAERGYESLIASDIIEYLGNSFQQLYGKF